MAVAEPMEQVVEEVHCVDCGVPMPTIPNWYAGVKVKFSCDACRQKSPRLTALAGLDADPPRALTAETDAEPVVDEVESEAEVGDDLEVEIEDTDLSEPADE